MKKHILLAFVALFTFASCELETSDNGDLDGQWHMESIDTIDGGTADYSKQTKFWAFQMHLMQTRDAATGEQFIYRFQHTGDSLIVTEPRVNNRDLGDTLVTDIIPLQKYGINSTEEHFMMEKLSGSKMILRTKRLRLSFKKM